MTDNAKFKTEIHKPKTVVQVETVGGDVTVYSEPKYNLQSLVMIVLGIMFPMFACIVISIAGTSRYILEKIITTGVMEIISISIILLGSVFVGIFLFLIGSAKLFVSTVDTVINVKWGEAFQNLGATITKIRNEIKAHPDWGERIKQIFQSAKNSGQDWELKERFLAIGFSLVLPGSGLWYRGRKLLGVILLAATIIGYFEFLPGILFHLLAIILSGIINKPKA